MDLALTILFYVYVGLALSAPTFVIPAVVICRKSSNPSWKGVIAGVPLIGLPLFALLIRFPRASRRPAPSVEPR
jgi:hypothetical protein